jgi:hypothetical protein
MRTYTRAELDVEFAPLVLKNAGLLALTVEDEQKELQVVRFGTAHSLDARIKAADIRGRKIIFAFFQSDFKGGQIPYWHVTRHDSPSYGSTLSWQGLKQWRIL